MNPDIRDLLLNKFISLKGKEINNFKKTFTNIEFNEYPNQKYHMISAGGRGIYKPIDTPYALSIRTEKNNNPYNDKIFFDDNGNFEKLIYYGPKSSKNQTRAENDINSLISCYEDKIPFGIIYVLDKKKSYVCLGLGIIKSHKDNIYEIIPYNFFNNEQTKVEELSNEVELISSTDLSSNKITEQRYHLKVRTVQSEFRKNLLKKQKKCLICDIDFEPLLIASHIKPWFTSNSFEKRDINNGIILCPLHDKLFDKGYISFHDNKIIVSKRIESLNLLNAQLNKKFNFNNKQLEYLKFHFNSVFKND
ncbi:HNH endonuclease [Macrococcus epidermidis]|uniref:HNH endonuclease n=1 Tax=Macrococcus epidermidis TaxID=1902580 RepID=UPI001EF1912F|nr:HNH endonuclease [Macrococcus epidermidis]MCG7421225.1 HNH endonuclease [Macrococcus epidermidis]